MGKALYRSYRSKTLDEVVGQNHIVQTLKNSLKKNTYSHAYLLTGPRGVGKTSVARILAHAVNKVDYPADPPHMDIIEIDAASNRRIDEIRELRERVIIAPTSLKYKVYIIDEVHMLTREAFNALLKTLEEPPEHAIFILATTEINKVPDTIISRCLRFHFKLISNSDIVSHLSEIVKSENISIEADAIELIAKFSEGSFRDAIALLDQVRSIGDKVSVTEVENLLGLGSEKLVDDILSAISDGNAKRLLENLDKVQQNGVNEKLLASQILLKLKEEILDPKFLVDKHQVMQLSEDVLSSTAQYDIKSSLEIALLKGALINAKKEPIEISQKKQKPIETPDAGNDSKNPIEQPSKPTAVEKDTWADILTALKENDAKLYGIARMAKAQVAGDVLNLEFEFGFHYKQMNLDRNKQALQNELKKTAPSIKSIDIKLDKKSAASNNTDESLKSINNIFGSSELIES
jgi:DNA polymerase III subunit gamma/tau